MKKIFTLIALHFALLTFAQPGSLDTSFNPSDRGFSAGKGVSDIVFLNINSTIIQSDGKILVAGEFWTYNGVSRMKIARLNSDGSLDLTFNTDFGAYTDINAVVLQSDGKILVAGANVSKDGNEAFGIARLNPDGSFDNSFNQFTIYGGYGGRIDSMALQPDGKILIGGNFTKFNGLTQGGIVRVNGDGTLDTSFNPGTGISVDSQSVIYESIYSIAIQTNGKILIGGNFKSYNGVSQNGLACLNANGTLDTSFSNSGSVSNNSVSSIVVQPDDKILIAGNFDSGVVRLNANGSSDLLFNPGSGTNERVRDLVLQSDGQILIVGGFTTCNGITRNGIARLKSDGSLDTSFNPNIVYKDYEDNNKAEINAISLQADGKIMTFGLFTECNGKIRNGFARINPDGSLDKSFNPVTGANDTVLSMILQPDGKILVGGFFTSYNDVKRPGITRLNSDGSVDTSFDPGLGFRNGYNDFYVRAICLQSDGKILAGGRFSSYNGIEKYSIVRLNSNGSLDTTFNLVGASEVSSIAIQADGKILISNEYANGITRLNSDGSLDTSFNQCFASYSSIGSIVLQSDGKILIGGTFIKCNETTPIHLGRLNADGSWDADFSSNADFFRCILLQPDGKILIAGGLYEYNGSLKSIARLFADGSFDPSFNPVGVTNDEVCAIGLQSDGKILMGGRFIYYNDIKQNGIVCLNQDGTIDTTFKSGTGISGDMVNTNPAIYSILIQPDGTALIGGRFTSYKGVGRNRIARLNGANSSAKGDWFANSIQLYPNPVSEILTIKTEENIAPEVEIYDVLGKFVKTFISLDKKVDVSSLSSGVYIINVTDGENGVCRRKFVKK